MAKAEMVIKIADMPDVLSAIHVKVATLLREFAESEADPRVQRRLREVADLFEEGSVSGQKAPSHGGRGEMSEDVPRRTHHDDAACADGTTGRVRAQRESR